MTESAYQAKLIEKLNDEFPNCVVLKNDAKYLQGIPDLVIFSGSKYAMLEVKISKNASHQPNQDYYVKKFHSESFASFIFPENEDKVMSQLKVFFNK